MGPARRGPGSTPAGVSRRAAPTLSSRHRAVHACAFTTTPMCTVPWSSERPEVHGRRCGPLRPCPRPAPFPSPARHRRACCLQMCSFLVCRGWNRVTRGSRRGSLTARRSASRRGRTPLSRPSTLRGACPSSLRCTFCCFRCFVCRDSSCCEHPHTGFHVDTCSAFLGIRLGAESLGQAVTL